VPGGGEQVSLIINNLYFKGVKGSLVFHRGKVGHR